MADEDYLQEGFDPRSVTVPRLRSILVTHNVSFGNAKKPQLVALVEEHILPLVPRLREQRFKAKRSSMGIVNAGSAEDNGQWDDHDLAPPSTAKRARSPRKSSTKVKAEETDDAGSAFRSPSKRASRSVSRAISQGAEIVDYEAPRSARRTRRTITPQIKNESEDEAHLDEGESVFTDDNPFQSGSSPPQARPSSRRRRTGDGARLSRYTANEYDEVRHEDHRQLHLPKIRRQQTPTFEMEPGEEFTPDEQLELEEATHKGEVILPPRETSHRSHRRFNLTTPILVLLLTLLGSYGVWYRQEKIAVGYCGSGRPPNDLLPPEIPDFLLPFLDPPCETCPQHAYCFENFEARCQSGFILEQHPLSLGGLIPLRPSCEPDSEKARRVQAVADKAVEELRERRAKFECGELVDEDGNKPDSPAIPESELKETVSRKRSKRLNSVEFEDLWADAIGAVVSRDEVETKTYEKTPNSSAIPDRELSSTSLARVPISCAIKRSIRLGLERNRLPIGLLIASILVVFYLRSAYHKHTAITAQVPQLVNLALERLAHQRELGDEGFDDPWLFLPNLRDDVLRSIHSVAEREAIWRKVKAVVELNSNVRTSQREGRSGEVGRAWEWIGPVSEEGVRRRRSGRVSLASEFQAETPEPARQTPEVKKWEESRPVF